MTPALRSVLERRLGSAVRSHARLGGGDINEAFEIALEDGSAVFVKTHPRPPAGMFGAEAHGIEWLRQADAIRVPEVIAWSDESPAFLALELLRPAKRAPGFDEALGRSLAALHASGAPSFGLDRDNFIGKLPQANDPLESWASFYWVRRLEPQLRMATERGLIDDRMRRDFALLEAALEDRVGPTETPSRLHGDLWGGNLHVDARGAPCLIDPAVYGGNREVDLAMMRLFGGFGPHVFASYAESHPLAAGFEERVPLYQLYPLLVHVNLFGSGYVGSVRRALDSCL